MQVPAKDLWITFLVIAVFISFAFLPGRVIFAIIVLFLALNTLYHPFVLIRQKRKYELSNLQSLYSGSSSLVIFGALWWGFATGLWATAFLAISLIGWLGTIYFGIVKRQAIRHPYGLGPLTAALSIMRDPRVFRGVSGKEAVRQTWPMVFVMALFYLYIVYIRQ